MRDLMYSTAHLDVLHNMTGLEALYSPGICMEGASFWGQVLPQICSFPNLADLSEVSLEGEEMVSALSRITTLTRLSAYFREHKHAPPPPHSRTNRSPPPSPHKRTEK